MAQNQLNKVHRSPFCCINVQIPTNTSGTLLSHFLLALKTVHDKRQLPLFPQIQDPDTNFQAVVELEVRGRNMPYFYGYHFVPLMEGRFADEAYRAM